MQATSHSWLPVGHDELHAPESHTGVPPVGAEQGALQPPQFSGSVAALVSQPLVILLPSQSRNGSTQVVVQALL
jgi:hypothetical protein